MKIDVESHSTHLLIEHQAKLILNELTIRIEIFVQSARLSQHVIKFGRLL